MVPEAHGDRWHDGHVALGSMPPAATWRHHGARQGFESVFVQADPTGYRLEGHTAAVVDGQVWAVRFTVTLDERWLTRSATAWGRTADRATEVHLEADGRGRWEVDGAPAPALDGCLDVDFESSACTNTLPVHRLGLEVGQAADAPAAWVRALDLSVQRMDQWYARVADDGPRPQYDYRAAWAPSGEFACRLVYDEAGMVLEYPGIGSRIT